MSQAQLVYRRNEAPSRGLAATGIFLIKWLLALPHLIVVGALQYVAAAVAYIGFWVVALTGSMPQGISRLLEITFTWNARAYGWLIGLVDEYPPFETDPDYPITVELPTNESPNRGLAVTGIFLIKMLLLIPHFVVIIILLVAAAIATWVGYVAVLFSGSLPAGIQDFLAGVMQWNMRAYAWLVGFTDEYPPFSLEISPRED